MGIYDDPPARCQCGAYAWPHEAGFGKCAVNPYTFAREARVIAKQRQERALAEATLRSIYERVTEQLFLATSGFQVPAIQRVYDYSDDGMTAANLEMEVLGYYGYVPMSQAIDAGSTDPSPIGAGFLLGGMVGAAIGSVFTERRGGREFIVYVKR